MVLHAIGKHLAVFRVKLRDMAVLSQLKTTFLIRTGFQAPDRPQLI